MLDQRVHVVASTQDISHSTRNFSKIAGEYLGEERPLCLSMGTWLRHIDHFERKYDRAFAEDSLFGVDFMDRIHKRVQVSLHSYNITSVE